MMLDPIRWDSDWESIPAYDVSHLTEGILRGCAHGNNINSYTNNMVEKPEKGKIHFYIFNFSLAKVDIT